MTLTSIFGKAPAETETKRELSILEKCEAMLPIYQSYKNKKHNLEVQLRTMAFYVTDIRDPKLVLDYGKFTSEDKFRKAVKELNEKRAADHQKAIERVKKDLQDLETTTEANLLTFFL